jgi:uncharacterized secreted protein with C-terminal beta-propeller domain
MGSRLLAVGVESNRVAVSLFDVANPAKPGLLSRLLLGENYSWTEANYDEKAFTVLPDANLVWYPTAETPPTVGHPGTTYRSQTGQPCRPRNY